MLLPTEATIPEGDPEDALPWQKLVRLTSSTLITVCLTTH